MKSGQSLKQMPNLSRLLRLKFCVIILSDCQIQSRRRTTGLFKPNFSVSTNAQCPMPNAQCPITYRLLTSDRM
ncbi:MAG: hypothetical protein V7L05_33515 [Nostoc sp.]|uniref:hypothetical protein n=1 Tax=Nostoc sp. TaxID=1180 RepID=UPI002FFA24D2